MSHYLELDTVTIHVLETGPLAVNCWIVQDQATSQAAIFDPGGEADLIIGLLRRLGAQPVGIFNTHAHGDHIGANAQLHDQLQLPIAVHTAEQHWLTDPDLNLSAAFGIPVVSPPAQRLLTDGDMVDIGQTRLQVVHLPGHSPGSVAYLGAGFALVGDVIFRGSIGRTDLPGSNPAHMQASLEHVCTQWPPALLLLPGHGPETRLERELTANPFLAAGPDGKLDGWS